MNQVNLESNFAILNFDNNCDLKDIRICKNKIVRGGHEFIASGGGIKNLLGISVGSGSGTTLYTQNDLNEKIASSEKFEEIDYIQFPEYGFLSYFGVNQGVGTWTEIGAYYGVGDGNIFNRSEIVPPIIKEANQTAFAGSVVSIFRMSYNI